MGRWGVVRLPQHGASLLWTRTRAGHALGTMTGSTSRCTLVLPMDYSTAAKTRSRLLDREVLYKGRYMLPFRVLVRLKIFQLGGVAVFAASIGTFLSEGGVSFTSAAVAAALISGCAISASTLNFYSRRYIGELSLLRNTVQPQLCFSVLDFWGNRQDNVTSITEVVPPLQGLGDQGLKKMANQALIPLQVDGDRQYYISLRHGILVDKDKLLRILKGEFEGQDIAL